MATKPLVGVIMGSDSDLPVMNEAVKILTRKADRPADRLTKGSSAARLVHARGNECSAPVSSW